MTIENIYRNRTMNEITEGDVGKTLKVAGIINSMKSKGSWKMQTFSDERDTAVGVVRSDFLRFTHGLDKVRRFVNYPEDELAGAHEETR